MNEGAPRRRVACASVINFWTSACRRNVAKTSE